MARKLLAEPGPDVAGLAVPPMSVVEVSNLVNVSRVSPNATMEVLQVIIEIGSQPMVEISVNVGVVGVVEAGDEAVT